MKIGVLLLNFGEPENPTMDEVVPFLERIFALNSPLMGDGGTGEAEVRERSRRLAEARAPGLIAEYEEIGGSPLHRQAREQAIALAAELGERGLNAVVRVGMQFTDPSIQVAIDEVTEAGADFLVSIPVYPLSGPSTSVAALNEVDRVLAERGWSGPARQVTGWHRHPLYLKTRVDAIRRVVEEDGISLADPGTRLVFSAHGTPMKYLREGSRYDEYVREFCAAVARELGADDYVIGYQNHTNRPGVEWTQPDIEAVVDEIDAERIVVDAVSFIHEQSETLAELDDELRERVEERGIGFHRVPIPYLAPDFVSTLADLVEAAIEPSEARVALHPCRCKPTQGTICTNARD